MGEVGVGWGGGGRPSLTTGQLCAKAAVDTCMYNQVLSRPPRLNTYMATERLQLPICSQLVL